MTEQTKPLEYQKKLAFAEAMTELDTKEKTLASSGIYAKAYLLSVFIPPIGVYYFVKYVFFSGGDEKCVKAGIVSLVLTLISLFFSLLFMNGFAGQITTGTSQKNTKMLNELSAPKNQQQLLDLYK